MVLSSSTHGRYSHELLVHDRDEDLVEGTRAFVELGLASGAHVLVHGTSGHVALLHDVLGDTPGLEYGFDEELYQAPMRTLFTYQQKLAEIPPGTEFWVTGTVPQGRDATEQAAWARYESAVNEALSTFPFRALCTYDSRALPESVVAAALATHPSVSTDLTVGPSLQYVEPAAFLAHPLAHLPEPPSFPPSLVTSIAHLGHLARARYLLKTTASAASAVPQQSIHELLIAVNEVAANGLVHGAPPVHLSLWADVGTLTCQIVDSGPGIPDPMSGYRYPDDSSPLGLWAARQLVDDAVISNLPGGGCSVLLTKT